MQSGSDPRRAKTLRLFAWSWTVSQSTDFKLEEPYACKRDCQDAEGQWRDNVRAERGCGLLGVRPVAWKQTAKLYQIKKGTPYMGRPEYEVKPGHTELGMEFVAGQPMEASEDGCPGAWYRVPFIDSLAKYFRRRTPDGHRIPNPRFDAAHWRVQELVMVFEEEQERSIGYQERVMSERRERAAKKDNRHGR